MSAIAAVFFPDGRPVERADLDRMVARLAHRRLDTTIVWCDRCVGLGPHGAERDGLHVTADARLDNRPDLLAALELPRSSHLGDADLILRAYARWGEQCVEHLLGDFAFAIWDPRRRSLFCARDHMGVKPFYYHHRPGRLFACASEIKGLLALGDVPRTLNETRVADYLTPVLEDPAITFYDGIVRLPAAHCLVVTAAGARLERYWRLDADREQRPASDAACAETFRELFTLAVRDRLRSERPVGALLSGGLDSSSIACVARDLLAGTSHRLPTFSALFPNVPSMDERAFIDAVLASGGFDPAFVRADQLSPLTDAAAMLRAEDEPFYAPNLYMHWALYARAAAAGIGVMLDGFDGDTTVSHGILRLTELARAGRWRTAAREARGIAPGLGVSAWRLLRDYCVRPCVPGPARSAWRRLRDWIPGRHAPKRVQLVAPALAERVGLPERLATLLAARSQRVFTVRADQFRQLASGLLPFVLEVAERAAAAFGIEARFPFFDVRLVEFCLALLSDQKLRDGWTRSIERRAMDGILPPAVQWRRDKTNLFPHFIEALRRQERALLDRIVSDPSPELARYVDVDALRGAYVRYRARPAEDDALAVWRAATLALWLEQQVSVPSTLTGGMHHEHRQEHPAGQRVEAALR